MATVIKVKQYTKLPSSKRVCAYARVSCGKEEMLHSLSAQVSYYNNLIQSHRDWIFCGVFADEAISGTKDNRKEFNKMVDECLNNNIDLVITKSISRFARNTVTLLDTVRKLKEHNVDVYFEEQNLHSLSGEGELMLSILASFAQEEARSVSENMLWRIKKCFEEGKAYGMTVLGYRNVNGVLIVDKEEAKAVKLIYKLYLEGLGCKSIADELNARGYKTRYKKAFKLNSIFWILRNRTYTGNLLLQTTYRKDYLHKKTLRNNGEKAMYKVDDSHEAIISLETFENVQAEIQKRQEAAPNSFKRENHPFTKFIECEHCKHHFVRNKCRDVYFWRCTTYEKQGKAVCPSQKIPEKELIRLCNEILGTDEFDEKILQDKVNKIVAKDGQILTFYLKDNDVIDMKWIPISRKDSWTDEMRKAMSIKQKEKIYGNSNGN